MPSIPACKIFVGKNPDDDFNAWVLENPDNKIISTNTTFISQGAFDGNMMLVVGYIYESRILQFPKERT